MKKSHLITIVFLSFSVLLGSSCFLFKKGSRDFRVGIIAPLTGPMRNLGVSTLEGANLAVQERNGGGGLNVQGREYKVVLVTKDSEYSPELAVKCAKELINKENIAAIIGPPMSGLAIPVAQIASEALVPMITPVATHPDVTKNTRCVYRVCFTDEFQGQAMAEFTRGELGVRRAAVLYDIANDYNRNLAEIFRKKFTELGGVVVSFESYTTGETDFAPQVLRIKSKNPQVLFLPNYVNELHLQVEQIRASGIDAQIVGCDSMSFSDPEDTKKIEGAYFITHFLSETPSDGVRTFIEAYLRVFGRKPSASAALTYDALGLLFEAVKRAGSVEPAAVSEALAGVRSYAGVTGTMNFNGSADPVKTALIVRVVDGEARYRTFVAP
jgi:branched-chain amino acid transport system substrate-binding protein